MPDTKTRLLEAERALDRLEMQIEQYQLHLAELTSQVAATTKFGEQRGLATARAPGDYDEAIHFSCC